MAEIVLENVVKRYPDGALAVDNFNLTIADGEFIILVGPSGCGKSTTLNMVAGLEDITEGRLLIDGQVVNDKAPKDRDIAMVFQSLRALPPHDRRREHGLPAQARRRGQGDHRQEGEGGRRDAGRPSTWTGGPPTSPVGSASAWRWDARSFALQGVPHGRAAVEPRRQAARAGAHPVSRIQKATA